MTDWMVWFIVAGIVVILEMLSGTFYLLMLAIGLAAGGVSSLLGAGNSIPYVVAAVFGIAATFGLSRSKYGKVARSDSAQDPNVNLDIGQPISISEWKTEGQRFTARAMYRGAMWDVDLRQDSTAQPGEFIIREVRGSRLIVTNRSSANNSQ
ncbi:NfeD family protein [soil metagenome]